MPEAPQRMCVGCRRRRDKHELLRMSRTPDGVRFDPHQRLPGRGAYVCPDPHCIAAASRRGGQSVQRALHGAPDDEVHEALAAAAQGVGPRAPKELNA